MATVQVNVIPIYKTKRLKFRMLSNLHKVVEKVGEPMGTPEPV